MKEHSTIGEDIMKVINWISETWMWCYDMSAGWTVGITIVVGLYILSLFGDDEDDKPGLHERMANSPARKTVRLKYYRGMVYFAEGSRSLHSRVQVEATNKLDAERKILEHHEVASGLDNGTLVLRSVEYTGGSFDKVIYE